MTCNEAREAMVVAERHELIGQGDGELGAHVASCDACAAAARALGSAAAGLTAAVNRRARRRAAILVAVPAAAAAIVVAVFITRPTDDERVAAPHTIPGNVVSVDVKAGQHATVIKTSDPNVTVVWLSSGDGK